MKPNRLRTLARNIYHRLPLSQAIKWRLRERLYPLLMALQQSPSPAGLVRGMVDVVSGGGNNSLLVRDHDRERALAEILGQLGAHSRRFGPVSHWITLPFLSTGGAEMVALNICKALREVRPEHSIALLLTDRGLLTKQFLLPENVALIIFDDYLGEGANYKRKQSLLKDLLLAVRPEVLHNINSEVAWHLILAEGDRLKHIVRLYASIFAFQFSPDRQEKIGYAAYFLKQGMPHLAGLISDNQRFIDDAIIEYDIDKTQKSRMHVVYQPCRLLQPGNHNTLSQSSATNREALKRRPQILWAGRLDEEKRIDLFLDIVRDCDFADFRIFGQVVLDNETSFPQLPNLSYEGPFISPEQWIERFQFDALIFTSRWEGMPNTLIEAGALKIPIVAPTVGGVGELITKETGYPLPEQPSVADYAVALKAILFNPEETRIRTQRLSTLIARQHSWEAFIASVSAIPGYVELQSSNKLKTDSRNVASGINTNDPSSVAVSVIIPCFNQGRYLYECITSVLTACHSTMEIIVIDDGSTDIQTDHFLAAVTQIAPDVVRVHRQHNKGLSGARNSGIKLARGEFIQFLDADDVLIPGKIDAQLAQLVTNPMLDVSICNFLLCDETRNVYSKPDEAIAQFDLTLDDFLYRWERGFSIPIHCGLFRRAVVNNTGFDVHARAKEDWLFWTGLALAGVHFGYVHGHWAIYRQHANSMRRSHLNMGRSWLQAGLKIDAMLLGKEPLFFESLVSWFEQCYRMSPAYSEEIATLHDTASGDSTQDNVASDTNSVTINKTKAEQSIDTAALLKQLKGITLASCTRPLISVVVPIYNHYEYLNSCLQSIADQGDVSIEILCIDDASSDRRVTELMQLLSHQLDRLKIIIQPKNCGISNTQNTAVANATGDYVAFLDCDDALEPHALTTIKDQILANPEVDYFFTDRHDVNESGQLIRTARYGGYENLRFSSQMNIRADLLDGMVASHLKVIRRSTYLQVGGCNPEFSGVQDWDLALKIAEQGRFQYIDQALYRHRIHQSSVTRSDLVAQFRKTNVVRRWHSERCLRETKNSASTQKEKVFSKNMFPIKLNVLKDCWRHGYRCIADATGTLNISQINFLRDFNSYFDRIEWNDPAVPASLFGYLWDPQLIEIPVNQNMD